MKKTRAQLKPGWLMTEKQYWRYWAMWNGNDHTLGIKPIWQKLHGTKWTKEEEAKARQDWHCLAELGPVSAKAINHLKNFDDLIAAHLAITDPSNVDAQMRQLAMPKHRLITRIKELAPEGFWRAILKDRSDWADPSSPGFDGASRLGGQPKELEELEEWQLEQLRNTVQARAEKKLRVEGLGVEGGESDQSPVTSEQPEHAESNQPF